MEDGVVEMLRHEHFQDTGLFVSPNNRQQVQLNHGDNSALSRKNYQQTLATAIDGIAATGPRLCPVPGCMFNSLVPDHPCYRRPCKNLIHNLCAQGNNLCSKGNELNMYCSVVCKGSD